jgi:hypothetical protein
MTPERRELAKLVSHQVGPHYDKFDFTFNAAPSPQAISSGLIHTILFGPKKKATQQKVKKSMKTFVKEGKQRPLWSIILRYSRDNWERLMEYAETRELSFDLMYYDSSYGSLNIQPLFKCWMTLNKSWDYTIEQGQFIGDSAIHFKKIGIRVVKKAEEVVVRVCLLEK